MRVRVLVGGGVLLGIGLLLPLARAAAPPDPLAESSAGVASWLEGEATADQTATGNELFDHEWTFGAWQMAALGFAQEAERAPDRRATAMARLDASLERLYSPAGRAFDRREWGEDVLAALGDDRGHAAWLGYTNLALSSRRALDPGGRWAAENDDLSAAIVRRLEADLLPETYPDQRYPVDVAAMVASVGLWARVTGRDEPAVLTRWRHTLRRDWVDDGLLIQSVDGRGRPRDRARGSGTFLASWFLSRWDRAFATDLYVAGRDRLGVSMGPLRAMREYPPGVEGRGDIDSGPIVAGMGVSSTGFAIGAARAAGDLDTAHALERTATLVGQPATNDGELHWRAGTALGSPALADAILFAMMSTPPR
jgi:hypothetical protein